jgi:hypothetical protein
MARSVSVPSGAVQVWYALHDGDHEDFGDCIEDFREYVSSKYPSMEDCNRWIGREDRVVLENSHAAITVSSYCGLVAVAVVPKEDYAFSFAWAEKVDLSQAVKCFGRGMFSLGRASNGEQMFLPVEPLNDAEVEAGGEDLMGLGLGYSSNAGWL